MGYEFPLNKSSHKRMLQVKHSQQLRHFPPKRTNIKFICEIARMSRKAVTIKFQIGKQRAIKAGERFHLRAADACVCVCVVSACISISAHN